MAAVTICSDLEPPKIKSDTVSTVSPSICQEAIVKTIVFPVVMYGCESWTVKKAERQRIDAFNCGIGKDF